MLRRRRLGRRDDFLAIARGDEDGEEEQSGEK
jgi:hypothetical protein